jgi:hypothetical protein
MLHDPLLAEDAMVIAARRSQQARSAPITMTEWDGLRTGGGEAR